MLRRFAAGLAVAAAVIAVSPVARANGRYPAAGQIAVDPNDKTHVIVRATYGILSTINDGAEWNWICEPAVGYTGFEDPFMQITGSGNVLAGIFEGLSVSKDQGCDWSFAGGALVDRYAIDLAFYRADASKGVVLVSNGIDATTYSTEVYATTDGGNTWAQAGTDIPDTFIGVTVDVADSDPMRLYVSGRYGAPDFQGSIERSDDGGATWQRMDIPGTNDQNLPYIAGVDPTNADVVYVRALGDKHDTLFVTKDGGVTWSSIYTATGGLLGFALSPDGSKILMGGDVDGLLRGDRTTMSFTKVSDLGVRCLTWTNDGVYACADEFIDSFEAGFSKDDGATFTPILHLQALCGPTACGDATSVGKECADLWGATQMQISAYECDGDAGPDAGSGGSGAGGATASGTTSGGAVSNSDDSGCSLGGPEESATAAWAASGLLGALGLALFRRRRRRA